MSKKSFKKAALVLLALLVVYIGVPFVYPDVSRLKKENPKVTSMMKYRMAEWKSRGIKRGIDQRWVPFSRVSPYLVKAVIISEDDKFWTHEGFDFEAMEKAVEKDIKKRKLKAGGSTISQQLAKNLYLSPSKNPVRKLKEAIYTWRIEDNLSKRRILEIYLNIAEWGDGIFGIEAAARRYYGIPASALGPEQAARLASVLPNPRKYSPVNPSRYVERRSDFIYKIMVRRGIAIPDYEDVMSEPAEEAAGGPSLFGNYSGASRAQPGDFTDTAPGAVGG